MELNQKEDTMMKKISTYFRVFAVMLMAGAAFSACLSDNDEIGKQIEEKARKVGGHGGMDYIMDYRLIYCLQNGLPLDEDVYDGVEWSCLNELTRISLENGCIPVEVPDFTRGEWNKVKGFRYATK